jgi:hypothetical protein
MYKPFSTKTHAILDYLTGIVLILAPNLLGFADVGGAAVSIPRIVGAGIILLELITAMEYSIIKLVPMRIHLIIDMLAGVFLLLSPFLFGFNDERPIAWLPHVLVGLMIVAVAALSSDKPEYITNKATA